VCRPQTVALPRQKVLFRIVKCFVVRVPVVSWHVVCCTPQGLPASHAAAPVIASILFSAVVFPCAEDSGAFLCSPSSVLSGCLDVWLVTRPSNQCHVMQIGFERTFTAPLS
jgi:hypothetical protein